MNNIRKRRPKGQRKNTCSRCGKNSRKGQRYCNDCHAANMRKTRPVYSSLSELAKKKSNARAYANTYLKRGHIQKQSCEVSLCKEPAQMHHDDYNKPLEVRWLCRKHHLAYHKEKIV